MQTLSRSKESNMASGKPQKSVFIETSALIPMLEQGSVIQRRILQYLNTGKALVCMDTVVVSEYLAGVDESIDKNAVVERMSKQFRIHTFDSHTAIICAEMFRILKAKGQSPRTRSKRQITKADIMIMASATASGAKELLFNDGHFANYRKFLPGEIYGHKLPTFVRAEDLPPEIVQNELGIV